jgi:UDP-N-acetylglucosamine 2-epimerase (non-hydrolysing)
MRVLHVAGARPNFMKVAPVLRALGDRGVANALVHTGQHYDPSMSATFFDDLELPEPDVHLGVGSGTHGEQTARVMERLEPVLAREEPDLVIVVGDVNSTLAAAIVCAKGHIPVAHVEAGLRSFDRTMPEEINRVLSDQLSDLLFTTSPEAEVNLSNEGIAADKIHFVGNPMIDSLLRHLDRARESKALDLVGVEPGRYALVTLHRPSNVDDPETLRGILDGLRAIAERGPVVFPAHPRTIKTMRDNGLDGHVGLAAGPATPGVVGFIDPLGYIDFLALMAEARVVLTDSGGVQEETTILGVPCLTLRRNTERPITIEMGTNRLIASDGATITEAVSRVLDEPPPSPVHPPLWDGMAGDRIADIVLAWGSSR